VSPSLIDFLCAATSTAMALQSLFLCVALIAQPSRRSHANLALAIACLAFALVQGESILRYWAEDIPRSLYFWAASHLPLLFIPPFAYLHLVGLTSGPSWRFTLADVRHGVFCIAACLGLAAVMLLGSQDLARMLIRGMFLVTALQGVYYLLASLRLTRRGNSPQIAWLRLLLLSMAGFLVMHVAITSVNILLGDLPWAQLAAHIWATLVLYAISLGSLSHGKAFSKPPGEVLHALAAPLDKYRKTRQSAEDAKRLLFKLDQVIQTEAPHRDSNLTLPMLSAKVGATPNLVSRALNETLGMGFADYINRHRIDEAKRRLRGAGEDGTILEIAYDVGFNSKSTFNAAFKKHTGQTPSLFKKQRDPGPSV